MHHSLAKCIRRYCNMFFNLVIVVVVLWVTLAVWRGRRMRKSANQFRNDIPAWPVVGHALHWLGSEEDRMKAFSKFGMEANKQGGYTTLWLGQHLALILSDPVTTEFILKKCLNKDEKTMKFVRAATGNGIAFSRVAVWRPRRKTLAPIFSQNTLNKFVEVFEKKSAELVYQLRAAADGTDFSVWKYFNVTTFNSTCKTTMGIELNAQYHGHPFLDAFETGSRLLAQRITQPWLHCELLYKMLPQHKLLQATMDYGFHFVDQIVEAKRNELADRKNINTEKNSNESDEGMKPFLEMLMESPDEFSNLALREEIMSILMAGTDTSAVGMSFATVLLSRYPEEQAKVYDEIEGIFGDSERVLDYDDLSRLRYLEAFVKETLRMYPPVPIINREVEHDIKLPSGETLVAGTSVLINIPAMHRNPRYWGADAEQFRPSRFLEGVLPHPAQFIPFSYGMRNCIGYQYAMMSMKTVMASLVRRYRVLPPAGMARAQLAAPLRVKYEVMMRHVDNYVVRLQPRS